MSAREFERVMVRDLGIVGLVVAAICVASMLGPVWLGGVLAIVLIPVVAVVLVALIVLDERAYRRRDSEPKHAWEGSE
jgi:hypothetical protein